jgi:hypothetical protein
MEEYNILMDIEERVHEIVDQIHLAQNMVQSRAHVNHQLLAELYDCRQGHDAMQPSKYSRCQCFGGISSIFRIYLNVIIIVA